MKRKRIRITDTAFQMRATFHIVGIYILITTIVVITLALWVNGSNRLLSDSAKNLTAAATVLEKDAADMQAQASRQKAAIRKSGANAAERLRENARVIQNSSEVINDLTGRNFIVLIIIIVFCAIQIPILYLLFIRKTSDISGPVFVMKRLIREILDGKMPEYHPLRENDEFKELYDLLSKLLIKYGKDTKSRSIIK
jgi:hypothetical protein